MTKHGAAAVVGVEVETFETSIASYKTVMDETKEAISAALAAETDVAPGGLFEAAGEPKELLVIKKANHLLSSSKDLKKFT